MPTPFRIDIPDSDIADLHARLDAARWPDQIGDPWVYGTDITYLKELCTTGATTSTGARRKRS